MRYSPYFRGFTCSIILPTLSAQYKQEIRIQDLSLPFASSARRTGGPMIGFPPQFDGISKSQERLSIPTQVIETTEAAVDGESFMRS